MKVNVTEPLEIFLMSISISCYLSIFVVLRAQNVTNQTLGYKFIQYSIEVSFNFAINFSGTRNTKGTPYVEM